MKKRWKKILTILAILVVALGAAYILLGALPRQENYIGLNSQRTQGELPLLIAHGGGNKEFPDNTLEAFYNAYSVDSRVLMETDVSITKDGVVILSHDTTLDRKTNVTGAIADWNYADLIAQKVDFGYTNPTEDGVLSGERVKFTTEDGKTVTPLDVEYPQGVAPRDEEVFLATTLEELLEAFPENGINVEIKQSGELGMRCLAQVLQIVEAHDAFDRVVLASFHEEIQAEFVRLLESGEVPENFMYSPAYGSATKFYVLQLLNLDMFYGDRVAVFQIPTEQYGLNLATRHIVQAAHKHNLAVQYWTIDDPQEMEMLIEIGADGIMTNYPHRLKGVYDTYSEKT